MSLPLSCFPFASVCLHQLMTAQELIPPAAKIAQTQNHFLPIAGQQIPRRVEIITNFNHLLLEIGILSQQDYTSCSFIW